MFEWNLFFKHKQTLANLGPICQLQTNNSKVSSVVELLFVELRNTKPCFDKMVRLIEVHLKSVF